MTTASPQTTFGLSCPYGGAFYICAAARVRFLGCCGADACAADGACPADQLFAASFDASAPGAAALQPQACDADADAVAWYTCSDAAPPFLGCCARDPCNAGCGGPDDHDLLRPARLSDDPRQAAQFLADPASSSSGSSTSSSSSSSATAAAVDEKKTPSEIGVVVGVSVAGIVVLLLAIAGYLGWKRRAEFRRAAEEAAEEEQRRRQQQQTLPPAQVMVQEHLWNRGAPPAQWPTAAAERLRPSRGTRSREAGVAGETVGW
ncbi:hypothetical protein F4780DRAFT_775949 [Xylariomycetidae sp. FL0641]|nr:hypothetical protein F4780DRAFT_775949 [Xylariomycetidae sp. FL0641]